MAPAPFPVCWPNTRRTAAIAVAAAPVASILRLIRSIVGVLLDKDLNREVHAAKTYCRSTVSSPFRNVITGSEEVRQSTCRQSAPVGGVLLLRSVRPDFGFALRVYQISELCSHSSADCRSLAAV